MGLEGVISGAVPAPCGLESPLDELTRVDLSGVSSVRDILSSEEETRPLGVETAVACSVLTSVLATALGAGPSPRKAKLMDREIRGSDGREGDFMIDFLVPKPGADGVLAFDMVLLSALRSRFSVC